MAQRILWIGDAHLPWLHKPTFSKILEITRAFKPDVIGQCGDLYDFFSFARFPKRPGFITPDQEITEGRATALEFWRLLRKAAPKASCYQLLGNHCIRPIKSAKEKAPELVCLVAPSLKELFSFDGIQTIHDPRQELVIDDTVFMHGFRSKLGDHCKYNSKNTVVGHSHRAGVYYHTTFDGQQIWELNVGFIADPNSEALSYNPQRYVAWNRGLGLIDSYGPRFIPL